MKYSERKEGRTVSRGYSTSVLAYISYVWNDQIGLYYRMKLLVIQFKMQMQE